MDCRRDGRGISPYCVAQPPSLSTASHCRRAFAVAKENGKTRFNQELASRRPSTASAFYGLSQIREHFMSQAPSSSADRSSISVLALGALGVVFGDIGTSPLYAIKESLHAAGHLSQANVFGVLSLVFWAVTIVVSVKYLSFIMRADNKGEGGILSLMALGAHANVAKARRRQIILVLAMIGAALFYGDAIITPAVSVLSAVEGLEVFAPGLAEVVVPLSLIILIALFAVQKRGSGAIGAVAGPLTALYFVVIAAAGIAQIVHTPSVLLALNPLYGFAFLLANLKIGFLTLGSVFLAVTGAEACYADMGHFGRTPIRLAWFALVFPALILNYFGQGALVLVNPQAAANPFYFMVPGILLMPMILLATIATVIASQAVISGAYSLTSQAIQLGLLPRMLVKHTSARERGQIYLPALNWVLMAAVAMVVLGFKSSSALANAYGIAVTGTMVATTLLAFFVTRDVWKWPLWRSIVVTGGFLIVDTTFFAANLLKFAQGGWMPLAVGVGVAVVITTWRKGREIIFTLRREQTVPLNSFMQSIGASSIHRVKGTAVYLTAEPEGVPSALLHNLKHNQVLHEHVVLLTVNSEEVPRISENKRIEVISLGKRFWRVVLRYGFMEQPDIPAALTLAAEHGLPVEPMLTSFFLGRETLVPSERPRMMLWRESLFIAMMRLAQSAPDFFKIPSNRVIEVGTKMEI
jgi:KUP system potassium uptake protein